MAAEAAVVQRAQEKVRALLAYRGTSPIRNTPLLGLYSRTIPRVLWWSPRTPKSPRGVLGALALSYGRGTLVRP